MGVELLNVTANFFMSSIGLSVDRSSHKVLLRWGDRSGLSSHEQIVEMVQARRSETTIRSFLNVDAETEVHLIGKNYVSRGVVQSCFSEGPTFIVTILMKLDYPQSDPSTAQRDPGLSVLESFLTQEAEDRILGEFGNDASRGRLSRFLELTAMLVRFLRVRSLSLSST